MIPPFQERRVIDRRRPSTPITVVVVDEEAEIRQALSQALESAGFQVVGEAASAQDAIELAVDLRPDVVLMDIQLKSGHGLDAVEQIALLAPASPVLVLTRSEQNQVVDAIIAGASGYILKTALPQEIIRAVKATSQGAAVLSPQIAGSLLERIRDRDMPVTGTGKEAGDAIRAALTERELEIFTRLASGDGNQKIGEDLGLSTNTVRNHIASILHKLHLDNRIQAAAQAIRAGIS